MKRIGVGAFDERILKDTRTPVPIEKTLEEQSIERDQRFLKMLGIGGASILLLLLIIVFLIVKRIGFFRSAGILLIVVLILVFRRRKH